jgi:endonuclease/exonuclease/phosphatase family metal-dependent hydrolase
LIVTLVAIVLLPTGIASALPPGGQDVARGNPRPVKVMTRNLYLGADLTPVLSATSIPDLALKAAQIFGEVQATDFPARAKLLAWEIQDADPHLIGLQEVALWRTGAPGVLDGPVTPATTVVYDFLAGLQAELANLGLQYTLVVAQDEFDAEVPSALGFDIRLTQRDVILAKANLPADELSLSNASSANFSTNLSLPTVAGPVISTRGWTSVDATVNRRTFRFINTHLEAFSAFHRFAQSNELLAGPANTSLPVTLVGDLNSHPAETGTFLAYANLIGAGFVDTWTQANPSDPGFTCCNAADLLNPTPTHTVRIDHVLTRPSVEVFKSKVVGVDQDNRTPSGLWPSDHAGVVSTLRP